MEFDEYVRHALPPLMRFAVVLTGDVELAQDVVQEALLRACSRWATVQRAGNPHAYVRRIVVHEAVSWRRKWGRIHPAPEAVLERSVTDPLTFDARDALLRELNRLPARQRAVLVLRYFEELSDDEIAATLGCRPVTVRGYAHRALTALRIESHEALQAFR